MKETMKATLCDVVIEIDGDVDFPREVTVGVVEGGWQLGMESTDIDVSTYFFFDELSEIEIGADLGDNTRIIGFQDEGLFYAAEEEYEPCYLED